MSGGFGLGRLCEGLCCSERLGLGGSKCDVLAGAFLGNEVKRFAGVGMNKPPLRAGSSTEDVSVIMGATGKGL